MARRSYPVLLFLPGFLLGISSLSSLGALLLLGYRFTIIKVALLAVLAGVVSDEPIFTPSLLSPDQRYFVEVTAPPRYVAAGEVRFKLKIVGVYHDAKVEPFWYPSRRECVTSDLPWRNTSLVREGTRAIINVSSDIGLPYWCRIKSIALLNKTRASLPELLRGRIIKTTFQLTGDNPGSRALLSMLFGIRDLLTQPLEIAFRKLGISHLLVLSGYQITLLYGLIVRRRGKFAMLLGFVVTSMLLFISGWESSGLRAWLALFLVAAATLLERRNDLFNIILVSIFALCVVEPQSLFDPSTHLTFAALIGIWLGIQKSSNSRKFIRYLYITLFCYLSTGIVAAIWFKTFSLVGFFVNCVLAVPLAMLTVPVTLLAYAVFLIGIDSKALLLNLIVMILNKTVALIDSLGNLPGIMLMLTPLTQIGVVLSLIAMLFGSYITPIYKLHQNPTR